MVFRIFKNSAFDSQRKRNAYNKQSASKMLESELKDIREKLRRIEEELAGNVIQMKSEPENRAA